MSDNHTTYGLKVTGGKYGPRGVIGNMGMTPSGNLAMSVGEENSHSRSSWVKVAHVVMAPDEASRFAYSILDMLGRDAAARHNKLAEGNDYASRQASREETAKDRRDLN